MEVALDEVEHLGLSPDFVELIYFQKGRASWVQGSKRRLTWPQKGDVGAPWVLIFLPLQFSQELALNVHFLHLIYKFCRLCVDSYAMIAGFHDDFSAALKDSEASKEIQSSQELDVNCTQSLKLFRCWNARWRKPSGTFVVWEKNDKHSQDGTWVCLCSGMLISLLWWLTGVTDSWNNSE